MAVDPATGDVWLQENGDDSFSEVNRIEPGLYGGWVQIASPVSRIAQFKEIETTFGGQNLQQLRWPPTNVADTPDEAPSRLFLLPGARYSDPEFSWKMGGGSGRHRLPRQPSTRATVRGRPVLFVGADTPLLEGGYLFRFKLTGNNRQVAVNDPRLGDRVADNLAKHEITESKSLLIGTDFGVTTDVETGPNGNLFVVSLTDGAVYKVFRR
jgi:hypothetical protein